MKRLTSLISKANSSIWRALAATCEWPLAALKRLLKLVATHGPLVATLASAAASVASAAIFLYSLRYARESALIAAEAYQRTIESKFSARYRFVGDDEYLVVRNTGPNVARDITVRREPFFVFSDRVESASHLGYELSHDGSLLRKLRKAGILADSRQYFDLIGPSREFSVEELKVGRESELELSHFSNINGIRIAEGLNCLFVVRWRIEFVLDPDRRESSQTLDFWLAPSNTRLELSELEWGEGVSSRIVDAIHHSPDLPLASNSISLSAGRGPR